MPRQGAMDGGSRPALTGLHDVLCQSRNSGSFGLRVAVPSPQLRLQAFCHRPNALNPKASSEKYVPWAQEILFHLLEPPFSVPYTNDSILLADPSWCKIFSSQRRSLCGSLVLSCLGTGTACSSKILILRALETLLLKNV